VGGCDNGELAQLPHLGNLGEGIPLLYIEATQFFVENVSEVRFGIQRDQRKRGEAG
jgi:hypothetical protein